MTISASDRAYLLGSKSYMVQIQRILKQQLDQTMDLDQLRSFYHDLSEGRFRSTIYSMSAKGIISLGDNTVTLIRETIPKGEVTDRIWKAVSIRKIFTFDELTNILPDVLPTTIRIYLTKWTQSGAVTVVSGDGFNDCAIVYKAMQAEKPVLHLAKRTARKDDSNSGRLIRLVWHALDSYGSKPFTPSMLLADIEAEVDQWRFVQHLLTSWERMGLIRCKGFNGSEYIYRVNRTLVTKMGVNAWKEAN